jgi:hypothetical protein
MQRVRLRRTALRANPRMNTSAQPPEGAGGSRAKATAKATAKSNNNSNSNSNSNSNNQAKRAA